MSFSIRDIDWSKLEEMWERHRKNLEAYGPIKKLPRGDTDQLPGWREWLEKRDKPARYYSPYWKPEDDDPAAS